MKEKSPLAIFDESVRGLVNNERAATYGHPLIHFTRSAAVKEILRCDDPQMQHVIDMIADKLVRLTHSPRHLDSWIDVAGYARTAVMCMDEARYGGTTNDQEPYREEEKSR